MADKSSNDANTSENSPPAPQMINVEIVRDFWDENADRQPAGTVISVTVDAALEGIETGALKRAKK